MVRLTRKTLKIFGAAIGSSAILSLPLAAQQFTVSPLVTISGSTTGQSKGSINVTNQDRETLRVRIYAEHFTYDRRKGFVSIPSDSRSAVPYLQFSPREMEIPPGVTRNVRVAITLPPSLPNQEYRAVVFIEDLKEREVRTNRSALSIKARVASVFFLSKGSSTSDLQSNSAVWDTTKKSLSISVENKGRQTAYPEISWRLEKDSKEIASNIVRGVIIQSENLRDIELQSVGQSLQLASGEYKLSGSISTNGQKPAPFSFRVLIP
jgi:hypothetical protein